MRFTNEEVYKNLEGVLEVIFQVAEEGTKKKAQAEKSPPYEGGDLGEVVSVRS